MAFGFCFTGMDCFHFAESFLLRDMTYAWWIFVTNSASDSSRKFMASTS